MSFSFFSWVLHLGGNVLPKVEFFSLSFFLEFCPWVLVFSGVKKKAGLNQLNHPTTSGTPTSSVTITTSGTQTTSITQPPQSHQFYKLSFWKEKWKSMSLNGIMSWFNSTSGLFKDYRRMNRYQARVNQGQPSPSSLNLQCWCAWLRHFALF